MLPKQLIEKEDAEYEADGDDKGNLNECDNSSVRGFPIGCDARITAEDWNNQKNGISLDQVVAAQVGDQTRFASLVLGGGSNLSWNNRGMAIPVEGSIKKIFKDWFINGTPAQVEREIQRLAEGHSILDGVRDQAGSLAKSLSSSDRDRIDMMLTSVRDAEKRLQQYEAWPTTAWAEEHASRAESHELAFSHVWRAALAREAACGTRGAARIKFVYPEFFPLAASRQRVLGLAGVDIEPVAHKSRRRDAIPDRVLHRWVNSLGQVLGAENEALPSRFDPRHWGQSWAAA